MPPTASPSSASPRRRPRGGSIPKVVLYTTDGCRLCERARGTLAALREEHEFELDEVDIGGDPKLEARYREWLPVVEIDGERAFVYYLDAAAFLRRLGGRGQRAKGS